MIIFSNGRPLFTFGVNFAPLVHYIIAGDGMALITHQTKSVEKTEGAHGNISLFAKIIGMKLQPTCYNSLSVAFVM